MWHDLCAKGAFEDDEPFISEDVAAGCIGLLVCAYKRIKLQTVSNILTKASSASAPNRIIHYDFQGGIGSGIRNGGCLNG